VYRYSLKPTQQIALHNLVVIYLTTDSYSSLITFWYFSTFIEIKIILW